MKIFALNDIPNEYFHLVGGKARGLNILMKNGYKVPNGYVVCEATESDIDELWSFYSKNFKKPIAVRSSATLEDGLVFSSAGQYETFLNVSKEEEFKQAIIKCLKSADDEKIKKYNKFFGQEDSKMNIVLQEMIQPKSAGVCFSINPTNRKNEIVIEAVEGLGDALVSGMTNSKQYTFDKEDDGSSFTSDDLLSVNNFKDLIETVKIMEETFVAHVDVEWAVDQNGEVNYLQIRPITTLNDPTIDELNTKYDVTGDIITNHNVGEMLPEAITPLTISTVVYAIDYGLRVMLKKVGLVKRIKDIPEELLISHYYGHLFFNMKYLYRLTKSVLGATKKSIDIALCGQVLEFEQKDNYKGKNGLLKLWNGLRYAKYLMSSKKAIKHVAKVPNKIKFDYTNIESLYSSISKNIHYLNEVLSDHYITSCFSGTMSSAVYQVLIKNNEVDVAKQKLTSVLENIEGIESVDILSSMRKIVVSLLKDDESVKNLSDDELIKYINESASEDTKNLYKMFIEKHGHRTVRESELRIPGWKDDEKSLSSHLKVVMMSIDKVKDTQKQNKDNITQVLSEYKGFTKRILRFLIKKARKGCVSREFSKSKMIITVDMFKHAYRKLATMLVENGALTDVDLIYFLSHKEIGDLAKGKNPKYIKIANIRKRLLNEQMRLKFDHITIGEPKPLIVKPSDIKQGTVLLGTPLSRGQFEGKARIVLSIEDAKLLEKDEIMIAGYTDIGWSPYYSTVGALITEVGSTLSHGAVVAREYSLPLVSNVNNATNIIKNGDILNVDGEKGIIVIVSKSENI